MLPKSAAHQYAPSKAGEDGIHVASKKKRASSLERTRRAVEELASNCSSLLSVLHSLRSSYTSLAVLASNSSSERPSFLNTNRLGFGRGASSAEALYLSKGVLLGPAREQRVTRAGNAGSSAHSSSKCEGAPSSARSQIALEACVGCSMNLCGRLGNPGWV